MKTITHIFKTYFPYTQGGLEEAIRQIAKISLNAGYRVRVVCVSKTNEKLVLDGVECLSYMRSCGNSSMPISFSMIRDFKTILADTDIIQLHYPYPIGELLTLLYSTNKPIIITFHCEILGRKLLRLCYEPLLRRLCNKASVIIPTSLNLLKSTSILSRYHYKSKIVNLWLDSQRLQNIPEQHISYPEKYVLFVGVLRWYKGLDILLDAAKKIECDVIVIGKGPLYDKLKKRISSERIYNVKLLGYQPDEIVFQYMKNCSTFVLPSISPAEAFGQVLLEASYFHRPMITTELGTGTSYVNLDKVTGFVVNPNDSDAIAEKVNLLLSNESIRLTMGENAYLRYLENFTEEVQGNRYLEIYSELLKNTD